MNTEDYPFGIVGKLTSLLPIDVINASYSDTIIIFIKKSFS